MTYFKTLALSHLVLVWGLFMNNFECCVGEGHSCDTGVIGNYIEDCPMEVASLNDGDHIDLDFRTFTVPLPDNVNLTTSGYVLKSTTNRVTMPGPVIRTAKGARITMNLSNSMTVVPHPPDASAAVLAKDPRESYRINIHTHGLHISSLEDNPKIVIYPNETQAYEFNVPGNHAGGTHWYHSHINQLAELHIAGGALGMWIVEDDPDAFEVPQEIMDLPEKLLVFTELLIRQMMIIAQGLHSHNYKSWVYDQNIGYTGELPDAGGPLNAEYYLVNGMVQPRVRLVTNQPTRLRMLHVAPSLPLELFLDPSDGTDCEMVLIAKDGVYLSVQRPTGTTDNRIRLATASRADIVITCRAAGSYRLRYDHVSGTGGNNAQDTSLTFEVTDPVQPLANPIEVLFKPCMPSYLEDTFNRSIPLSEVQSLPNARLIGAGPLFVQFDNNFPRFQGWSNTPPAHTFPSEMKDQIQEFHVARRPHPMHIHINHFQVVSWTAANDNIQQWDQPGDWVDTFRTEPYFSDVDPIRIRMRLDTFGNHMVYHCHNVAHSDEGALGYIELDWEDDTTFKSFRDTCNQQVFLATEAPSAAPTTSPTTAAPSSSPTTSPVRPTPLPTSSPVLPLQPTASPTPPTASPTLSPSMTPSISPTQLPTRTPVTESPSTSPTSFLPTVAVRLESMGSAEPVKRVGSDAVVLGSEVALGAGEGQVQLAWSQEDQVKLPDRVFLSPPESQSGLLALDPLVLWNPGNGAVGPYRFRLTASLVDAEQGYIGAQFSEIEITANSPPRGGRLSVFSFGASFGNSSALQVFAFEESITLSTSSWQDQDGDSISYKFAFMLGTNEYAYITPNINAQSLDILAPLPSRENQIQVVVALATDSFGAVSIPSGADIHRGLQLIIPEFITPKIAEVRAIATNQYKLKAQVDSGLVKLVPLASVLLVPDKLNSNDAKELQVAVVDAIISLMSVPEYVSSDNAQIALQILSRTVPSSDLDAELTLKLIHGLNTILRAWLTSVEIKVKQGTSFAAVSSLMDRSTLRYAMLVINKVVEREFVQEQGQRSDDITSLQDVKENIDLFARCKVITAYEEAVHLVAITTLFSKVPEQIADKVTMEQVVIWAQRGGLNTFQAGSTLTLGSGTETAQLIMAQTNETTTTDISDVFLDKDPIMVYALSKFNPFESYRECNTGVEARTAGEGPRDQQLLSNVVQIRTLDGSAPYRPVNVPGYVLVTPLAITTPVTLAEVASSGKRMYCGYFDTAALEFSSTGCRIGVQEGSETTPITTVECTCAQTSGDLAVWVEDFSEPVVLRPHALEFTGLILGPIAFIFLLFAAWSTWRDRRDREKLRLGVHNILVEERKVILQRTMDAWKASRKSRGRGTVMARRKEERDRDKRQDRPQEVMFWQSQIVVSLWDSWILSLFRQHSVFSTAYTYHPYLSRLERSALLCAVPLGSLMLSSILYDGGSYRAYEVRVPVLVFASLAVVPVHLLRALIPSLRSDTFAKFGTYAHMYRFLNARLVLGLGNILHDSGYRKRVGWRDEAFEVNYALLRAQDQVIHIQWRLKLARQALRALEKDRGRTDSPVEEGAVVPVAEGTSEVESMHAEVKRLERREERADKKLKRVTALHVTSHHGADASQKAVERSPGWALVGVAFLVMYVAVCIALVVLFATLNTFSFETLTSWGVTSAIGTAVSLFVVDPLVLLIVLMFGACRGRSSARNRNQKLVMAHARGSNRRMKVNRNSGSGRNNRRKRFSSSATSTHSDASSRRGFMGFNSLFKSSRELDVSETSDPGVHRSGLVAPAVRSKVKKKKSTTSQHSGNNSGSAASWGAQFFGRGRQGTREEDDMEVTQSDWNLV